MPYIDPTGENPGWSLDPQPTLGFTAFVGAPPEVKMVPQSVSAYQAEVTMRKHGIWEDASALFIALEEDDARRIAWLRAPTFNRDSPSLLYAAEQMGLTPGQLDALFIEAGEVL